MNPAAGIEIAWYEPLIPITLLLLMASMGMELVLADFKRVLEMPRAAIVGLCGQMILLPLAGLALAQWPGFSPAVSIGIVIIAACPGGAASNIFSYLARANIALSVTLTTLSCTLCFITIPLWINLGVSLFGESLGLKGTGGEFPVVQAGIQLFVVTLLPVAIGMGIRARWPAFSNRVRVPLRRSMAGMMAIAMLGIVGSEWETIEANFPSSAGAAIVLVVGMLGAAYALARLSGLPERDAFTISIEVGLQNGALATLVVVTLLGKPELLVFPGTYAVVSFGPVLLWTLWMRRRFSD
jgi:BASS family bile acid:Na+ symporter